MSAVEKSFTEYFESLLASVSVVVVIVPVPVPVAVAVIFMFVVPAIITDTFLVPFMIVIEAATGTIPVTLVEATAFVARANPMSPGIGGLRPITFMPAVVPGDGIPVTANPHEIRARLRGHNGDDTRRRRRADHDSNRDLCFCGNAGQQECGKGGSFKCNSHSSVRLLEQCCGLAYIPR
jgi:hypothetical protein